MDHEVDAISGATITGDGVTAMISERLAHYTPYFKNTLDANKEEVTAPEGMEEIEAVTEEAEPIAYQN